MRMLIPGDSVQLGDKWYTVAFKPYMHSGILHIPTMTHGVGKLLKVAGDAKLNTNANERYTWTRNPKWSK